MNDEYKDPNIAHLYEDVLRINPKNLAPDESSEAWELLKYLYRKERRKKWRSIAIRTSAALAAGIVVGTLIYQRASREK